MDNTLFSCRQWLFEDQHEYGEFGKHEINIQTDLQRTLEMSFIKPNIFSSIIAYYALRATGDMPKSVDENFNGWLECIRADTGYWTAASGKTTPFPGSAEWSRSNNLRHTAKCLDFYLLSDFFTYEDANVFNEIIKCQLDDGSFPQFKGMSSDLWSTAYFVNLLIRATMEEKLKVTCPRGINISVWKNNLKNILSRAVDWLLLKLGSDSLWHIKGVDCVDTTIAMLVEIGGYLALHKREECATIIRALLKTKTQKSAFIYVACLSIDTLNIQEQETIIGLYKETISNNNLCITDLIDAISICKLHYLNNNIGILLYYRNISNGHESQMLALEEWDRSEYFKWSLDLVYNKKISGKINPIQEAEFWVYINNCIDKVKNNIENSRGWEILWQQDIPVNEEKVQVYINGLLGSFCEADKVNVIREQETGRGPVDFTFFNNYVNSCILEIKLATNSALKNGDFLAQIYEYAKGLNITSAFLIIVDFYFETREVMNRAEKYITMFRQVHNDFYIKMVYIDASKKISASKISLADIS